MARMPKPEPVPVPNSLVASAARVGVRGVSNLSRPTRADGWHAEAWRFYHTIGEFRYACDWVGGMLSKALIHATREKDGVVSKVESGPAAEYINELFGNADGRAEMFRLIGIHMSVTGECHIIAYPDTDPMGDGGDIWEIAASTKVQQPTYDGGKWRVNDKELQCNADDVLHIRIWRPDPIDPEVSVSPTRSILSTLGELERLTDHVAAQVDSRLAGAGILLMPSEMTFPVPPTAEGETSVRIANTAEDLMKVITDTMATSIEDRSDASALVPIVITAPAEAIAAVKHLTFWTELDKQAIELRNEAIRRLALGMDMPPEVLQGISESNHWSAWQADESAIKSHTEPLLKIITTALAKRYLRPLLHGNRDTEGELRHYSIAADTSEMRLRPNRSKEALELHQLGLLSRAAVIRETGFEETDIMDEEEYAKWLTQKVAGGSTTPELVAAALKQLGVKLPLALEAIADIDQPKEVQEARPMPSLEEHPTKDVPDREEGERRRGHRQNGDVPSATTERKYAQGALIAAADQVVVRALERAGNKIKNQMRFKPTMSASSLYQVFKVEDVEAMLDDAWGQVEVLAERHKVDPEWLGTALHTYTSGLLETQTPHDFQRFAGYMVLSMSVGNQMEEAA